MSIIFSVRLYKIIAQTCLLLSIISVSQIHADVSITLEDGLLSNNYFGKDYVVIAPAVEGSSLLKQLLD